MEKEILKEILEHLKLIEDQKGVISDEINDLRTLMAKEMGFEDSDGQPKTSDVKSGIVNKLISYVDNGKNKIEEELNTFNEYKKVVEQNSVLSRKIKKILELKIAKKEIEGLLSDIKKAAKTNLDQEEYNKVLLAASELIRAEKEETPIEIYIKNKQEGIEYTSAVLKELIN